MKVKLCLTFGLLPKQRKVITSIANRMLTEMSKTPQVEGGRVTARESGLDPETEQLT